MRNWIVALLLTGAVAAQAAEGPLLKYRFTPDQTLDYVTQTTLEGMINFAPDQGQGQQMPLTMSVDDTMRYQVSTVKPDGSAWVTVELTGLKFHGKLMDNQIDLEMEDIGGMIMINAGTRNWLVERPGDGPAPPPENIGPGFTTLDAANLFQPVKMLLSPTGEILEQEGLSWQETLAGSNPLGGWLPILRPFGDGLPELPGRAVEAGQTWQQERQLVLPMADEKFPLQLNYSLAPAGGEEPGVPFQYEATLNMNDVAMTVEPMAGVKVAVNLTNLESALAGTANFDPDSGTLNRQSLKTDIFTEGRGQMGIGFGLGTTLNINSERRLGLNLPGA